MVASEEEEKKKKERMGLHSFLFALFHWTKKFFLFILLLCIGLMAFWILFHFSMFSAWLVFHDDCNDLGKEKGKFTANNLTHWKGTGGKESTLPIFV